MAQPDDAEIARRVRAARIIADLRTVEELAERIGTRGLGAKTLGAIERGERRPRGMELREIADACRLPPEFFSADLWDLAAGDSGDVQDRLTELERRMERLEGSGADVLGDRTGRMAEGLTGEGAAGG